MPAKAFEEILKKIDEVKFLETFDIIVAIANGGIVPAAILNQKLNIEFQLLKISFRDNCQNPKYDTPQLISPFSFDVKDKTILLVEDRVKTGATLKFAAELFKEARLVKTFAVNGKADYSLYDESCFRFPWIL